VCVVELQRVEQPRMVAQVLNCAADDVQIRRIEHGVLSRVHRDAHTARTNLLRDAIDLTGVHLIPGQSGGQTGTERYKIGADAVHRDAVLNVIVDHALRRGEVFTRKGKKPLGRSKFARASPNLRAFYRNAQAGVTDSHRISLLSYLRCNSYRYLDYTNNANSMQQ